MPINISSLAGPSAAYPSANASSSSGGTGGAQHLFAALFLITVAGITLFVAMVGLSKLALGSWHDSVAESES